MRYLALCGLLAAMAVGGCGPTQKQKAIAEFEVGHVDQARAMLKEVLERTPSDPEALYYMGRAMHAQKNYVQAIYFYRSCLDADPGCAPAKRFLVKAEQEAGMEVERLR